MTFKMRKAFTLVELLVVISIIALLLAVLMPSLQKARELAKNTVCKTRLKSLSLGIAIYANDYNNYLVPGDCLAGHGIWSMRFEGPNTGTRGPVNLGHLIELGILPMPTSNSHPYYCPTMETGRQLWGGTFESSGPFAATLPRGFEGWGISGREVNISYDYRDTIDGEPFNGIRIVADKIKAMEVKKLISGRIALISDFFSHGSAMYAHIDKYNYSLSDGSVSTLKDPGHPYSIAERFEWLGDFGGTNHFDDALFFGGILENPGRIKEFLDPVTGWDALP